MLALYARVRIDRSDTFGTIEGIGRRNAHVKVDGTRTTRKIARGRLTVVAE